MRTRNFLQELQSLQQQQSALEQEWRDLPRCEHQAKLKGDRDAVLELTIRRAQVPWEWVDTFQRRAQVVIDALEARESQLEERAKPLRARLVRATEMLETAWREVEQLQQEYGKLNARKENELPFYRLERMRYGMAFYNWHTERDDLRQEFEVVEAFLNFCMNLKQSIEANDAEAVERVIKMVEGEHAHDIALYKGAESRLMRKLESS